MWVWFGLVWFGGKSSGDGDGDVAGGGRQVGANPWLAFFPSTPLLALGVGCLCIVWVWLVDRCGVVCSSARATPLDNPNKRVVQDVLFVRQR